MMTVIKHRSHITIDPRGQRTETASIYFPQSYRFDSIQNLISSATDNQDSHYQYDDTSQLIREKTPHTTNTYTNDSLYNRTQKNDTLYEVTDFFDEELSSRVEKKRSSRPEPDVRAEGNPHTIIERPGPEGQYTTHNGDGTFKQYRGSGKPHGNIPRPNVKETQNNPSPSGPRPGKPEVRRPTPDEIPKG